MIYKQGEKLFVKLSDDFWDYRKDNDLRALAFQGIINKGKGFIFKVSIELSEKDTDSEVYWGVIKNVQIGYINAKPNERGGWLEVASPLDIIKDRLK